MFLPDMVHAPSALGVKIISINATALKKLRESLPGKWSPSKQISTRSYTTVAFQNDYLFGHEHRDWHL